MKTVAVTGAAGGMGRATCALLREKGYRVWALDRAALEEEDYIQADLTDLSAVEKAAEAIKAESGKIDAIVNLAGKYDLNSLVEMDEKDFQNIFDVNVFSLFRVNKAFLPLLSEKGRIVITSSELAPLDPLPFTGIYGITKTAVERYAYSLRMELQLLGHTVSIIRPGAVKTGLLDVSTERLDSFVENTRLYSCNAERFRRIVDSVEAKSVSPEKVAEKILKALQAKRPRYVYNLNRNPLLRLLNVLPQHFQNWVIRLILK